jgi:acetylornithine deacetylase/succinyl-diaminopimelate desuccinylase-like protein
MGKIEGARTRKPKYRRQDISNAIPLAPIGQWVYRAFEATFATEPVRIRMMGGTVPTGAAVEALQAPFVIVPLVNADNNQHSFNENMRLGNYVDGVKGILGLLQQEF